MARIQWDDRERRAIEYCALRFDGYKYFDENRLTVSETIHISDPAMDFVSTNIPTFDDFLDDPDYNLPINFLHAVFFMLQRAWMREGWLRPNSFGAKIARTLFLRLCREEIDERERERGFYSEWVAHHADHVEEYVELVRHYDSTTKYTSKKLWREGRR